METFLEILKFTIPGLIVFATAYFLLKLYLDDRQKGNFLLQNIEAQKITLPLRLQAYERLILLCERVSLPALLLRVRAPGMTVNELRNALLLNISQEFDHNTSQQLYVSNTLWQIISLAKDQTLTLVSKSASALDGNSDCDLLVEELFKELELQGPIPMIQKTLVAIRTEAGQLF